MNVDMNVKKFNILFTIFINSNYLQLTTIRILSITFIT